MSNPHSTSDRISRLTEKAADVVGDYRLAQEWLHTPNRALGGDTPIARAQTESGVREVEDLLGRIAHGVVT